MRLIHVALLAVLGLGALYLAAEVVTAGGFGLPLDDGWIHAAYARNLARGRGLSLGGDLGWVPGSTAPLWTWLTAVLFVGLGPGVAPLKALGLLSALAAVLAMARLARAATGDARVAGLAAVALAVTPRLLWGAVSGMEVPLYVALVLLGLALHLERRARPCSGWWPAPLVLALAGWARPECFVFVVVAALDRRGWRELLGAALLLLPYAVYHLAFPGWGHPLPTTFYAKAADHTPFAVLASSGASAALGSLVTSAARELAAFAAWLPTHLPLVVLGVVPALRHGRRVGNGVPFLLVSLLVFVLVRGALGFAGPWAQYGRYFAHAWPLLLVVGLHGLRLAPPRQWLTGATLLATALATALWPRHALLFLFDHGAADAGLLALESWFIALPLAVWLLLAALAAWSGPGESPPAARGPAAVLLAVALVWFAVGNGCGAVHHGRNVRDTNACQVVMAERVRALLPAGAELACHDIGALGFLTEFRLLDLAGIATPAILARPRVHGELDAAGFLAARRPRWFCVLDGWLGKLFPGGARPAGLVGHRELLRIDLPDNVTVGGTTFHLLELDWR